MAIKTYRLAAGLDNASGAMAEADQAAATRTDGWVVGKLAIGNQSNYVAGTKRDTTGFSVANRPDDWGGGGGQTFVTPSGSPITGVFANTAWTFTFAVRATTVNAQRGRVRLRVYKASVPSGSGAVELTAATQIGTTTAVLSTTADVTSVVTWNPGTTITLNNEYLFFSLAWEVTTAGGNNSADVQFRTGQAAAGTRLVTPDLAAAATPVNSSDSGTVTEGASVVITAAFKSSSDAGVIAEDVLVQFPVTLIDDFNRVNGPVYAGAGSEIWTDHVVGATDLTPVVIENNQITISALYQTCCTKIVLPQDFDYLIDCKASVTYGVYFIFNITQSDQATCSRIHIGFQVDAWYGIEYVGGGSGQALAGALSQPPPAAGETIKLVKRGNSVSVYRAPTGSGNFTLIGTWPVSGALVGGGAIGLSLWDTDQRWDNLRGGPLAAPTATPISGSDVNSGTTENVSVAVAVSASEPTGPETEVATVTAAASSTDTGAAAENISLVRAQVTSSDSGAVAENISLVRTQVSASDSGGIAEAISLVQTQVSSSDTGGISEATSLSAASILSGDAGTISDVASMSSVTPKSSSDSGGIFEAVSLVLAPILTSDVGTTSEVISLSLAPILVSDAGTIAEATTFSLAPIVVSDAGAISDNALLVRATKSDSDVATSLELVNVDTGAPPGSASVFTVRVSALRSNDALRGISVLQVTGAFDIGVVSESAALVVKQASSDANFATVENFTLVAKSLTADQNGVFAEVASFAYAPASSDANSVTTENVSLVARPITADTNSVTTETGVSTIAVAHADSGTIVETITLLARPIVADSGVATENSVSTVILGSSDTGTASTETASTVVSALGVSDTGLGSDQGVVRAYTASGDVSTSTESASLAARPVTGDSGSVTEGAILGSRLSTADVNGITVEFTVTGLATADQGYGIDDVIIFAGYTDSDTGTATEDILLTLKGGKPKPYAPHQIQAAEVREAVLVAAGIESGELEISEHEIPRLVSAGTAKVAIESARHDIPTITSSLR
jgi:hypothetical protein